MTPQEFIKKWKPVALNERQTAQEHFLDLCRVFDHPTPAEDDPTGERFTFEKGVSKTGGGDGFADVWKKGHFAWEYKKKKRDLDAALLQLVQYAAALENPPLHIVCDTVRFKIVTAWTNEVPKVYYFDLDDLAEPHNLKTMRAVFHDPESLRSKQSRAVLTKKAADKFQSISDSLQHRNADREAVAHFINQLVFCFFADSVKLLPEGLWKKLLALCLKRHRESKQYFDKLFAEMERRDGALDLTEIRYFNGGLFDGKRALQLDEGELGVLLDLTSLSWSLIDPTIFGTLFERFLDPDKRAQIGAHYTDPEKIMMIVEPVILRPLRKEWADIRGQIAAIMSPVASGEAPANRAAAQKLDKKIAEARVRAEGVRDVFIERLTKLRILDPACGSGNFLYLALQAVKDLEYLALLEAESLGLNKPSPRVGPEILHGIEINPFAAELARTTIWIGDIQWRLHNAIQHHPEPILRKLDSIECKDALIEKRGDAWVEATWPETDFIVGNPPFLGGKLLRKGLGDEYVEGMFKVFADRAPAEADLVCYWFVKAWEHMTRGQAARAGLVSTNSIRGGANRRVLAPIAEAGAIFEAWSDEAWVVDGASVRVSLTCFGADSSFSRETGEGGASALDEGAETGAAPEFDIAPRLDGKLVARINADLSAAESDLTRAMRLVENAGVAFMGDTKGGAFDIDGKLARDWLAEPLNANGRPNSDVLKSWVNGLDLTRRPRDMWIIDFGWEMNEREAAFYEQPFGFIKEHVKPERAKNRRDAYRKNWWRHVEARPAMWRHFAISEKYIATPTVAKHRLFEKLGVMVCPDHQLIAIARDDDTTFGILHSRFHETWSLRLGTWLGVGNDPRYTPTTTFETFPFPEGLTPDIPAQKYAKDKRALRIAAAAKKLDDLRRAWLNPPDLVDIVPEITPTAAPGVAPIKYPDRILPKNVEAAAKLKERTLTNLYNQRPQWLADAHVDLDRAVAAAYGWTEDISTDAALAKLLELNLARAAAQGAR